VVVVTYIERTIRGANPRLMIDVGLITCREWMARVKASNVAEKDA
jgi:hypothetical protein